MKRLAFKVVALLLLGAIVNVAVAWGCALCLPFPQFERTRVREPWPIQVPHTWAEPSWRSWQASSAGILLTIMNAQDPNDSMKGFTYANVTTGWPRGSMQMDFLSERYMTNPSQIVQRRHSLSWGSLAASADPALPYRALPFCPTWPGFAINTLFYAVILWVIFAAPFALRRRIRGGRIKRGLCPKCGYDLRNRPSDSAACPECGAARLPATAG